MLFPSCAPKSFANYSEETQKQPFICVDQTLYTPHSWLYTLSQQLRIHSCHSLTVGTSRKFNMRTVPKCKHGVLSYILIQFLLGGLKKTTLFFLTDVEQWTLFKANHVVITTIQILILNYILCTEHLFSELTFNNSFTVICTKLILQSMFCEEHHIGHLSGVGIKYLKYVDNKCK